jgi:hypothetical protein
VLDIAMQAGLDVRSLVRKALSGVYHDPDAWPASAASASTWNLWPKARHTVYTEEQESHIG